ncbi:ATPase [Micromonospora zingiberis]|uniref:ATPase n=1 Tax=Micromonospora zingiberis TaxID=2053011 RepID=A0A4R0GMT4_9ACTN|nr:SRPBCC family protein [Micromonospora zingiberis]TCB96879.1 ATPase [Micromonospora zingiberis]
MDLRFKIAGRISRPVHEVFEAVVDPEQLSGYFTTGGAKGRLATGATVSWDFADFPGAFPVEVVEVEQDRRIVLRWAAADDPGEPATVEPTAAGAYCTTVTMEFEPLGGDRTLVTIAEEGWRPTAEGQRASYGNCEGWTSMLCCMKAWLEHGINLRTGFYA